MKYKLTYIPYKIGSCIPHPHYDLHTDEKEPSNIACILADKNSISIIRRMVNLINNDSK